MADFIGRVSDIVFKMMNFVVRLAPLGVFGAIAFTVGKYGIGSLKQLGGLVALFYVAVAVFVVVVLGTVMRFCGFSLFGCPRLARGTDHRSWHRGWRQRAATDHAEARAPRHQAVDRWAGHLTGYSFNLDAFSIYLTLAAVFIAQAPHAAGDGDLLAILGIAS